MLTSPQLHRPAVPRITRTNVVLDAVRKALDNYREVLDADVDLRSISVDIKLHKNRLSVRAVIISTQGETSCD